MIPARRTMRIIPVLMGLALAGCQSQDQPPMSDTAARKAPDQELWGSTVILSVKGQNRAKVWADHILKFEAEHTIVMDGSIQVDFFNEQGEHVSVLTARGGEVDEASQDLRAMGQVVVISDDGARLETERLQWRHATQKIVSDTLVTIIRGEEIIVGIGFESDADLRRWEVKENVTGVVRRNRSAVP